MDKDPTPGDPERVRKLAKTLHDFADDVSDALRLVKGMTGESTLAEWAGKSATVFKEEFSGVPKNLRKRIGACCPTTASLGESAGQEPFPTGSRIATHST
ncbi:hypothetical protein ABZX91_05980 [Streptomyces coeruleorubidus]